MGGAPAGIEPKGPGINISQAYERENAMRMTWPAAEPPWTAPEAELGSEGQRRAKGNEKAEPGGRQAPSRRRIFE